MSLLRKYWLILSSIVLINMIFVITFFLSPLSFYYRGWEYLEDLGYKGYFSKSWNGVHKGDLGRKHYFLYQEGRQITSSIDEFGYRVPKTKEENYPIIVFGDSFAYGSGLDDTETFHQKLTELSGIAAYNMSKGTLESGLNHPRLKNAKIIIEVFNEKTFANEYGSYTLTKLPFDRKASATGTWLNSLLSVPTERYLFPSVLIRTLTRISRDISILFANNFHAPKYLYDNFNFTDKDLDVSTRYFAQRGQQLEALGYKYYLISIPRKQSFYHPHTSEYMKSYSQKVFTQLTKLGVKSLDVTPELLKLKESTELYIPNDTHWSPEAVDSVVSQFVKKYGDQLK